MSNLQIAHICRVILSRWFTIFRTFSTTDWHKFLSLRFNGHFPGELG